MLLLQLSFKLTFEGDGLRTLTLAYKDFSDFDKDSKEDVEKELTLVSIVGIEDPIRPEVPDAVKECQRGLLINCSYLITKHCENAAGITVRMVTGDNILTAKNIGKKCGILTEDGMAIEGPEFQKLTDEEIDEIIPKLQVCK